MLNWLLFGDILWVTSQITKEDIFSFTAVFLSCRFQEVCEINGYLWDI